ncbi:conserved Plasmodium protein, unknown function [Plasmodium gallinaceum]|uniref:Chorein N-terminal domain-containing protein n=1 Tax=Plasmodium gallinaceum TaxID=5849 RepID=A0A1J1GLC2_PLAGA|nr:conserved Plasmodium protein, unknown function [Plasmodium gallinaceum]CRG93208.1 conserved Plasmodium protein, unknown function [Plasmodium gallinaceum]
MIDIMLKMFLGKYFESCDHNFITMNMNAGIEIRNIIIKNDEINNFLKSKNIDIEIVYLKIEKINISFKTLSGILTLKLQGVDLRVKSNIHRNTTKGIKNKIKKFLNTNQGDNIKLYSPYDTQNIHYESVKLENEVLCCYCDKYKNVENSLSCYNNYNNIKKYICNECSILKNKNNKNNLRLIQKQTFLKNKSSKYYNRNDIYLANIPYINVIDINNIDRSSYGEKINSNCLNFNHSKNFKYYNGNSQLNNKKEIKRDTHTFKNSNSNLKKDKNLSKCELFLESSNDIKSTSKYDLNQINDYNCTNKLNENICLDIHKQEEGNINTLCELSKRSSHNFCKIKNKCLSNSDVFKNIYLSDNNKLHYANSLNENKSLNITKNYDEIQQYPYNYIEKKNNELKNYEKEIGEIDKNGKIYKKNNMSHPILYKNNIVSENKKVQKLNFENILRQNELLGNILNKKFCYINKINEKLNNMKINKEIPTNVMYNKTNEEKCSYNVKNKYNLLYSYNDIYNNKDNKIKIDNIFNFK